MTAWKPPARGEIVTCETIAAIAVHASRIVDRDVHLAGHRTPRPLALCGLPVDWDTMIPVTAACVSCRRCKALLPGGVR